MASLNSVHLLGNLTRDIELRFSPSGTAVGKMGLAINEHYTQNGERKERTVFVDVTLFGKTAENCANFLKKGAPALVVGRLNLETWDDKQSGAKRSKLGVVAENVQFLGSKPEGQRSAPRPAPAAAPSDDAPPMDNSDPSVPF